MDIDAKATKCPHCQADQRAWPKKHPILTAIAVIIVIGIVASAAGGSKSSSSSSPSTPSNSGTAQTQDQTQSPAPTMAKLNQPVQSGDLSFIATQITNAKSLGNDFMKKDAQGTFKIVTLKISNTGKETKTVDSSMIKLKDGQGRTFERSIDGQTAKGLSQGKVDLFLQQIQPSLSVTGDIVFDIPADATNLKLEVQGGLCRILLRSTRRPSREREEQAERRALQIHCRESWSAESLPPKYNRWQHPTGLRVSRPMPLHLSLQESPEWRHSCTTG
jgi:hypothetical protein